ncbi:hypothetical protein BDF14DRAFT_1799977 [Spinellus fusiger]|nr:hypothetical protein BDF14DRAFT_1799977 [Spinellus fusiger]
MSSYDVQSSSPSQPESPDDVSPPDTKTSTTPVIELVDVHGRITLDNVYRNGLHSLRQLKIRNVSEWSVLVKMRSNLRHQIAFQLRNENIADFSEAELQGLATNTVAWSQAKLSDTCHSNQLFNHVNHIDQLELSPFSTHTFILAFLPEAQSTGAQEKDTDTTEHDMGYGQDTSQDEDAYEQFNITGSLFFFAYKLPDTHKKEMTARIDQQQDGLVTSALADYQLSVKFRASVCQSVLWTDVAETGLHFNDCILGETYHRDFLLRNKSNIDLYWLLNTIDLSNLNQEGWLEFTDADTQASLDHCLIPSYSHQRIRLAFIPKEVGEFNYDLQMENANDSKNVIQTKVHATVRSVLHKESLMVSSGNLLDFGDCISGQWAVQQVVLNNISDSVVEVHFSPEGADMIFNIKSNLDTSEENKSKYNALLGESPEAKWKKNRKYDRDSLSRNAYTSPSITAASTSEVSGPNSEVSSRSSSPTPSMQGTRHSDRDRSSSPASKEYSLKKYSFSVSDGGGHTVGTASIEGDSDTDTGPQTATGMYFANTINESVIPVLTSAESYTRIEDLLLRPGQERVIQVSYRPQKDSSINDFNAGQLIRRNFRITLEYGHYRSADPKERKAIQCRARTCTSFVEVIPKEINFGDTDVGTLKSLPINIFNRSDILARVELQFTSKVLNCLRGEIVIQPRSYVELKLDLYPRKVNPEYRKQITLVNYLNHENDQIIEVQSTNIDKNRVTFHSLFYRILTATGANFLDFGSIALNSPSIRTFTIENIRDKRLVLELSSSMREDIVIYTKRRPTAITNACKRKSMPQPHTNGLLTPSTQPNPANLSIATHHTPRHGIESKREAFLRRLRSPSQRIDRPYAATAYLDLATSPLSPPHTHRKRPVYPSFEKTKLSQDHTTRHLHHRGKGVGLGVGGLRHSTEDPTLAKNYSISSSCSSSAFTTSHSMTTSTTTNTNDTRPHSHSHSHSHPHSYPHSHSHSHPHTRTHTRPHPHPRPTDTPTPLQHVDSFETLPEKSKRPMGITAARYKSKKNLDWPDIAGKSRVPFDDLISVLEHGSKAMPLLFPKQAAEEQYVRHQLAWRRELDRLVEKGDLVPTSLVQVEPQGEEEVVIVFTPKGINKPHVHTSPKKQDGRIFLRLVDFDRNIEQTEFENLLDLDQSLIPVREVIVRAQLCRSSMDLGQKNINFGMVERNEKHAKTILLHNRSETPLLYAIRKSGSIASGDIDLGVGRYGIVRAFGKREIEFGFEPTLSGSFLEKLVVENICDRTNDQVLLLKAMVRKPSMFFVKSMALAFGPCMADQVCHRVETIVLTNTNKQSRLFEVRVDPNEVIFGRYFGEFDFTVEDDDANTLSKEAEEEVENLEQKLKIARRKDQPDKVKKYLKKLAKLKNIELEEMDEMAGDEAGEITEAHEPKLSVEKADTEQEIVLSVLPKESAAIFKKTSESVVFPLDSHASKTISVRFKAMTRPLQPESALSEEKGVTQLPARGRILAHEYKNTDVCKSIVYSAIICADQSAYSEALAADTQSNTRAQTTPEEPPTASEDKSVVAEDGVAEAVNSIQQTEALVLERTFFDGGKVEVDQKSAFYVKVSNISDMPVDYKFVIGSKERKIFTTEVPTPLAPFETRKVMFEILPTKVGKQLYTFSLHNRHTGTRQQFTLECLVHHATYLSFPSLLEDTKGELDLGYSYVDPGTKYSQVTPLLVKNISDQDLYITCQSNLSNQVLIFMDESGERGLIEQMPFKRDSMTTVWVAVQPNLLTGYLGNHADECRELVGGIKFSIYAQDDHTKEKKDPELLLMLNQTVKFTSIIGQSHLEVSDRIINLGYSDLLHEEFYGAFTIKNKSGQLPLDYEVECASGNVVLDRRGGTLKGWKSAKPRPSTLGYLDEKQRRASYGEEDSTFHLTQITFRIYAHRHGLLNEKIIVTNQHNSQEVFEIEIRLFVDCKKLDAWSPASGKLFQATNKGEQLDHSDHREAHPLPIVKWESIYICPSTPSDGDEHSVSPLHVLPLPEEEEKRFYRRDIEVANSSGLPMQLVVLSDVDITAGWMADEDKIREVYAFEQGAFLQRSGQLTLQPGQRIRVRVQCPSAEKLDEQGRSLALQGKSGSLKGMLLVYDLRQQLEMLAIELEALFCVSLAELEVDRIDLGKIGHTTSWKPTKFNFTVRNLADVPMIYGLEAPDFIDFVPLDKNGMSLSEKKLYIPSRKSQSVRATLDPRKMSDQSSGLHRFDVKIANQRNNNNTMVLRLKTFMTVFELDFERLTHGELILPTLHHPFSAQIAPCDNWFTVLNTTDDDIRFEIGADMSPDLANYVKVDVVSRYTNSPLKGSNALSPQGTIEVRVRASPNESSRLPRNRPDLTDPAGVVLANMWVTTRPNQKEQMEEDKIKEVIPLRAVILETPTFSLSERRLDFKLDTYYKEKQGTTEEGSPCLSPSTSTSGSGSDQVAPEYQCMPTQCPLTIINHASKTPLRFKATLEGPVEFHANDMVKIFSLAGDGTGIVEPGSTLTLSVSIVNPNSIPGQLKLHVDDLDALGESRQTASIYVTEIVWDL